MKKSRETRSRTWLARKVGQVWDGGVRRFGSSRETVRSATWMPSLRSSPWNSRGAPERVGRGHSHDQDFDLGVDGRAAAGGPGGELGPVLAEATPLPPQDGVGGHDHEGPSPPGPNPGQPDPDRMKRLAIP